MQNEITSSTRLIFLRMLSVILFVEKGIEEKIMNNCSTIRERFIDLFFNFYEQGVHPDRLFLSDQKQYVKQRAPIG